MRKEEMDYRFPRTIAVEVERYEELIRKEALYDLKARELQRKLEKGQYVDVEEAAFYNVLTPEAEEMLKKREKELQEQLSKITVEKVEG